MEGPRAELEGLKPTALRKRAIEEGAEEDAADEAFESDDPKEALIALILQTKASGAAATPRPRASTEDRDALEARLREEAMARARAEAGMVANGMVCSWKIIWLVVVVAVSALTVLFGLLCKTDGFSSFGCADQTTGTAVILVGVHMWLPAGWALMGEYRPDKRKALVSRDNKLLTIGSFLMFYALSMSVFGILCRADAMPTHPDCRATGFWLIFLAIFLMNPATLIVLGWVVKWNAKRVWLREDKEREPSKYKDSPGALTQWKACRLAGGPFFVVEGLILSVAGGLCIENVVEGCMGVWSELPPSMAPKMGLALNQIGPVMFIPGLFATGLTFLDNSHSCGFIGGYWLCVMGFVPLGFGLACVEDHLYDLQDGGWVDCGWGTEAGMTNRGKAVRATMAGILAAFTGLCTLAWWREPIRLRLSKIRTTIPFILGVLQFAGGTASTYYGWWCMEGLAPDCKPQGIVHLSVGPSLIVIGVYCVFICYFWWYPGMVKGDAPPESAQDDTDESKAIRERFMPISMGSLMSVAGCRLLWKGVEALVGGRHGSFSHNFGVVKTVLGASLLFVGLNFLATAKLRVPKTEGRPPGEPMYVLMALSSVSGLTLLVFSTLCMGRNLGWMGENDCKEVDAAILFFVGLGMLVFSLIPLGFINIERRHPGAIREHRLTFYPGFFLFLCPGLVAFFAGIACAEDVLLLVKGCHVTHGTGHWPLLVKGVVFGLIAALFGWFLCSFTVYAPMYAKVMRRSRATWSHSWIKVGLLLLLVGVILSAFGGSCLDNTLYSVVNCPRDHLGVGVTLVSLGPSMFVFGVFAVAMVIDWRWEEDGDAPAAKGDKTLADQEDLSAPLPPPRPDSDGALEPEPETDEIQLDSRLRGGNPDVPQESGEDSGPEPEPEPESSLDSGVEVGADAGEGVVFNPMRTASAMSDVSLDEGGGDGAGSEPEPEPELQPLTFRELKLQERTKINAQKAAEKREKQEVKEAKKAASAEDIAAARAAKEAALHADWVPHSPRMRTRLGSLFVTVGVTLEFLGGSCINEAFLFGPDGAASTLGVIGLSNGSIVADHLTTTFDGGGCERHKGIIMVTVGSSSLFIGLLFLACRQADEGIQIFHRFACNALVFAVTLLISGTSCMKTASCKGSSCPGTNPFRAETGCNWNDGAILVFTGSCIISFMSLIPWILSMLTRRYPEIIRKTGFAVGFGLVAVCAVVSTVGHLCQMDSLFRVHECQSRGLWRPSPHSGLKWAYWVRMVVTGWLGIFFGVLLILDAIYPDTRVQASERMHAVRSYKTLPLGRILTALGFILSFVGGMCLDDTLVGVEDCRGLGVAFLSLGPAQLLFGIFLVVYTCEWVLIGAEGQEHRRGTTEEIRAAIEKSAALPDAQTIEKGINVAFFGAALMALAITVHGVRVYRGGPTTVKESWALVATMFACFGLIVFTFGLVLAVNTGFANTDPSQSRWRKNKKGTLGADSSPPKPVGKTGASVLAGMGLGKGNRRRQSPSQNAAADANPNAGTSARSTGTGVADMQQQEQQENRQQEDMIRRGLGIGSAPDSAPTADGWRHAQAHSDAMAGLAFMSDPPSRPSPSHSQPVNLELDARIQGGGGAEREDEKARKKAENAAAKERQRQDKAQAKLQKQEEKDAAKKKKNLQSKGVKQGSDGVATGDGDVHVQHPEKLLEPEPEPEALSRRSFELIRNPGSSPDGAAAGTPTSKKEGSTSGTNDSSAGDNDDDEEDEEPRVLTAKLGLLCSAVGAWLAVLGSRCIWTVPEGSLNILSTNDTAFSDQFDGLSGHMDDISVSVSERIAGGCPRHRGIILLVVGTSSLFVGLLSLFSKSAHSGVQVWQSFAGVLFFFGMALMIVGNGCMEDMTDWSSNWTSLSANFVQPARIGCDSFDAAIMMLVSGASLTLSLVPTAIVHLDRRYGDIVRQRQFVVGGLVFSVGFIVAQFGLACARNNLWTIPDCPRRGHWNVSVKLLVWGWLSAAVGAFVMSTRMFPSFYAKILGRYEDVIKLASWRPKFSMYAGSSALICGVLFASFGGACLDNTLFSDCHANHLDTGVVLVSLGPSMFVFGLFTVVMAMDWRWTELDGDAEADTGTAAANTEPEPGEPGSGPVLNPMRTASALSAEGNDESAAVTGLQWAPESSKLRWRLGVWLGLIGAVLNIVGISCIKHSLFFSTSGFNTLNGTFLSEAEIPGELAAQFDLEQGCERYKGVIMVIVGSSSLFVGILFYLCETAFNFVDVCLYFTRDAFMFGFTLILVGSVCMDMAECKRCPRVEPAGFNWFDGVVMVCVGLWLAVAMSGIPYGWYTLWKYYPETVRQRVFQIGAGIWLLGIILFVPGLLCQSDNLYGVEGCQTKGRLWNHKWSHSVKLLFSGFMCIMVGTFVMSTKMFPGLYDKLVARIQQLQKQVPIIMGLICLAVGVVIASVGGACLDNTLIFVEDCVGDHLAVGTTLVTVGPAMFAFGTLFVMLSCDWQYDFDTVALSSTATTADGETAPLVDGAIVKPTSSDAKEPEPEPEQEQLNPYARRVRSRAIETSDEIKGDGKNMNAQNAKTVQERGLSQYLAPSFFADFSTFMTLRHSPRFVLGVIFMSLGVALAYIGGSCINQTQLAPECQRHKGIIMVTVGASALYVGIVFVGSAFSRTHVQLLSVIAANTFCFGFTLWVVGALCMGNAFGTHDGPAGCSLDDGILMVLVGFPLVFLAVFVAVGCAVPSFYGGLVSRLISLRRRWQFKGGLSLICLGAVCVSGGFIMGLREGHAYLALGFSFVITGACVLVIVADWSWDGESGGTNPGGYQEWSARPGAPSFFTGWDQKATMVHRPRFCFGLVMNFIGLILAAGGGKCINDTLPGIDACPRFHGIIYVTVGAVALFMGIFTTISTFSNCKAHSVALVLLELAVFGFVLSGVGWACFTDNLWGVERDAPAGCDRHDGAVMMFTGGGLVLVVAVSVGLMFAQANFPEIVMQKKWFLGFWIWASGTVLFSFGFACAANNLYRYEECDRKRKWSAAAQLLAIGWSAFAIGGISMSIATFPALYERIYNRMVAVRKHFGLWFGVIMFNVGWVVAGIGGACLDDTMVAVNDCQDLGKRLLVGGPMLWAIGLCLVVMTCDWEWPEDIEALNSGHFGEHVEDRNADIKNSGRERGSDGVMNPPAPPHRPAPPVPQRPGGAPSKPATNDIEGVQTGGDINPLTRSVQSNVVLDQSGNDKPEPLRREICKVGMDVLLLEDTKVRGVVLKKGRAHVQVDLSRSGGPRATFVRYEQLGLAPNAVELKRRDRGRFWKRHTLWFGLAFLTGAYTMLRLGVDCLLSIGWMAQVSNGACPFHRGMLLSCNGLTSLYVGVIFFGLTFVRKPRKVWLVVLLDTILIGVFIIATGIGCAQNREPFVPLICGHRREGALVIAGGAVFAAVALLPAVALSAQAFLPKAPQYGLASKYFWIGSILGMLAFVATAFGQLCEDNALKSLSIGNCPRTETVGPWSPAMKLKYWGGLAFVLSMGLFVFSFFERAVDNSRDFAKANKVLMVGFVLLLAATIWGTIGAHCAADYLLGVPDCPSVYDADGMLIFGATGSLSGLLVITIGWYKRKGLDDDLFISIIWLLTFILALLGGIGTVIGAACLNETKIWLSGSCKDGWGTVGFPVGRNILLLGVLMLLCNIYFHRRDTFRLTPQIREVVGSITGTQGFMWYCLAIAVGASSFGVGAPCLAGKLVHHPDCPEGVGAMMTAAGACLFCSSFAIFILRTVDARSRERIEKRATDPNAEWKRYSANPGCIPRNGLTVWEKPQVGVGRHKGKLQLGEQVAGCLVGLSAKSTTRWLRIVYPVGSGEAGWVLATVGDTEYLRPVRSADGQDEIVAMPDALDAEAALRRAEAYRQEQLEKKGLLEQQLHAIRDTLAREGGQSIAEMQRKLERFQSAQSTVHSVAPAAGQNNDALQQKLETLMRQHADAEAEAARVRASVAEVSRALGQESNARNELYQRAVDLQARKAASEAAMQQMGAEIDRAREDASSKFLEQAVAEGWVREDDHARKAELIAEGVMMLKLRQENARMAAAAERERNRHAEMQAGIESARQLMLHGGKLEDQNAQLQQALEAAREEERQQVQQMEWLRLNPADDSEDDVSDDSEGSDEDLQHHHQPHYQHRLHHRYRGRQNATASGLDSSDSDDGDGGVGGAGSDSDSHSSGSSLDDLILPAPPPPTRRPSPVAPAAVPPPAGSGSALTAARRGASAGGEVSPSTREALDDLEQLPVRPAAAVANPADSLDRRAHEELAALEEISIAAAD